MTNCYIGQHDDIREWFDGSCEEVVIPYIHKTCCKSFEEDFDDSDDNNVVYDIEENNEGETVLLVTYDRLFEGKRGTRTDEVRICPYCGAKIVVLSNEE